MSFRRLNSSDFDDVIDIIRAIYALGPGGCGATCGFTVAEITASLRIVAPHNTMTDAEVRNHLRAGKNTGTYNVVCMASVSQAELRAMAVAASAKASAVNGSNTSCGVLCEDSNNVSVNGVVNDPSNPSYAVCVQDLEDQGITNEPLYMINQNMANVNAANQVYVNHINAEAQRAVRARRIRAGLPAVAPLPCGVLCQDSNLQAVSGNAAGGNFACPGAFSAN